jgi:hypothetical protein
MSISRFGPFPVSKGDVLTGIIVQPNDEVVTIATGWVSFARVIGQTFDANGNDWTTPSDYPAPTLRDHSLIVRFGGGPWFQGGTDATLMVPIGGGGEIVLRTNDSDDWLWDNDGFWEVSLVVTRPDPPPPPPGPPQPILNIVSIEVVQVIQRSSDVVRLVQGKRTVVRVFVDSGLRSGQDVGAGPNRWPGVVGSLDVIDGTTGITLTTVTIPLNQTGSIIARDVASIDREQFDHSLNFELPLNILNHVALDIRATVHTTVPGASGSGATATGATRALFQSRSPQPLLPVLMELTNPAIAAPAPSMSSFFNAVMTGVLPRYPVPEDNFIIRPPFFWQTGNDLRIHNLLATMGWGTLLQQLATVRLVSSDPVDGIRCALVPDGDWGGWAGLGSPRIWGSWVPAFIVVASDVVAFAHELGHTFGLGHSNCTGQEGGYDGRLPGRIDDVGLNVTTSTVIPKLTPELMSYCRNGEQWPSVQFVNVILDEGVI